MRMLTQPAGELFCRRRCRARIHCPAWRKLALTIGVRNTCSHRNVALDSLHRGTLLPDPKYDKVRCIAVATCDDSEEVPAGNYTARVLMFVDKAADAPLRPPDGLHEMQVCF